MFQLSKNNMFHMPHNTAICEEILFLIKSIDIEKEVYTFKELAKLLLIAEVKENVFKDFHKKPYNQFTDENPLDKEKILSDLRKIYNLNRKKNGMSNSLFSDLMKNGPEKTTKKLLSLRIKNFENFVSDPKKYYDRLIETQYSITKTWNQNWVEFVRDFVDFLAYLGILPCYYKVPSSNSKEFDGYIVSDVLKNIKNGSLKFEDILLNYKYSNSSINIRRFHQFNIKVRPFYNGLKILKILKSKGINNIERRLFFATISCMKSDTQINEVIQFLQNFIGSNGNELSSRNSDESLSKEGGRVATGMQDFYLQFGLLKKERIGRCIYFSISEKGEEKISNTPPNAMFYGQTDTQTGLLYSPLVANMLLRFSKLAHNNKFELDYEKFVNSFKNVEKETINDCLSNLTELTPSPIKLITNSKIILNNFDYQYHVTPFVDFGSIDEINFIKSGHSTFSISKYEESQITFPPAEIINELKAASLSSDGTRYELALFEAMKLLPGKVKHMGQHTTGQRLSDLLWIVEVPEDGRIKKIGIIFEAKAGNSISSFDERKEIEDIRNTIIYNSDNLKNVDGIWIIVVDSDRIPESGNHGGARENSLQRSFMDKLFRIQLKTHQEFGIPILVTAFGIDPFLEYYKYIYAGCNDNDKKINPFIEQFFMKGNLFFDDYRYIRVLKYAEEIKPKLFI